MASKESYYGEWGISRQYMRSRKENRISFRERRKGNMVLGERKTIVWNRHAGGETEVGSQD